MIEIKNNKVIGNFKIDHYNNEEIPLDEYRAKFKKKSNKKCIYITEIANLYYEEKYNKNILEVLDDVYHSIPKCPVSNKVVSFKLTGCIILGKYASISWELISKHVASTNENYKQHVENMKVDRLGENNPMFGIQAWNKGLNKDNNEIMKQNAENRRGYKTSDEVKEKQSISAKKRLIHGHTGIKHSEESKQIMREKTIARMKAGKFPQTNSVPHQKVRIMLDNIFPNQYEEEFTYGHFSFDFKLNNYLIEVQGDFWHANPQTRHSGATHSVQRVNVSRDRAKKKFVEKEKTYTLIEFWEYDIINNPNYIEKCLQNLI